MKKQKFLATFVAIIFAAFFTSCNQSEQPIEEETVVDPIYGTTPVDTTWWSGTNESENTYFPLEEFKALGRENDTLGQRAMVDRYRKVLTTNVVAHYPRISDERNINFVLGSGYARNVKSGDGRLYSGEFRNELIIVIDDPQVKETLFLACGNGMLSPLEFYFQSDFGQGDPWIEVKENDSYAKFFPQTWGELAKDADVGIRDSKGEKVTPRVYLQRRGKYISMLRAGDKVNLITGEVRDENWRRVDFDSRQHDTEVANAAERAKIQKAKVQKIKAQKAKRKSAKKPVNRSRK